MLSFQSSLSNTVVDDDDDDLSGFLPGLATLCAALGSSWFFFTTDGTAPAVNLYLPILVAFYDMQENTVVQFSSHRNHKRSHISVSWHTVIATYQTSLQYPCKHGVPSAKMLLIGSCWLFSVNGSQAFFPTRQHLLHDSSTVTGMPKYLWNSIPTASVILIACITCIT